MWTTSLDGQAVRGRQTRAGTLICFVKTGWPSGSTWLYGRKSRGRWGLIQNLRASV